MKKIKLLQTKLAFLFANWNLPLTEAPPPVQVKISILLAGDFFLLSNK